MKRMLPLEAIANGDKDAEYLIECLDYTGSTAYHCAPGSGVTGSIHRAYRYCLEGIAGINRSHTWIILIEKDDNLYLIERTLRGMNPYNKNILTNTLAKPERFL